MTLISTKTMKYTALSFCLALGAALASPKALAKTDAEVKEEMSKFSEENAKLREDHIGNMREVHVNHVNGIYDRKLQHNKEMDELRKQMKVGDKEGNKAIKEKIKEKRKEFEKAEKANNKEFKENILKDKNKAFRGTMKDRYKNMKGRHKN